MSCISRRGRLHLVQIAMAKLFQYFCHTESKCLQILIFVFRSLTSISNEQIAFTTKSKRLRGVYILLDAMAWRDECFVQTSVKTRARSASPKPETSSARHACALSVALERLCVHPDCDDRLSCSLTDAGRAEGVPGSQSKYSC
jgi:hypothetical protein